MKKWNVGWGPVSACNMKCRFCYSKKKRSGVKGDLSFEDWKKFIDENHDRINTINYGTGENTLDSNWFRLVRYIRDTYPNIRQALTTNGHLSKAVEDPYCLEAFIEAIDEVDVSLDFSDKEQHNSFRGQPDAYDWAIETLKLCQTYHKPATIVFLGSKQNLSIDNIDGLFSIAKRYNAILRMNMYRPTEGIDDKSRQFIVDYETVVEVLKHISDKYRIIALNDVLFSTVLSDATIEDPSGDKSIRILSDGSITPSTYLINNDYIVANIKEADVLEKLEREELISTIINDEIPTECTGCVYVNACKGGVYDRRFLWNGLLSRKDPYCPMTFEKRAVPSITIKNNGFVSVHDGYLPTMFFSAD